MLPYINNNKSFSISYPATWKIKDADTVNTRDYNASGVSFVFSANATHSQLLNAKFHIAKEQTCPPISDTTSVTINRVTFKKSNWSDVGAGNLYEGVTYFTQKDGSCYLLSGYMHSCNLQDACPEDHRKAFDKQLLLAIFEQMAATFKLQ